MKYNEEESILIDMICESNEEVRDSLYQKHEKTIKYIVNKYVNSAKKLGLDYNDLLQEANVAFIDAINNYNEEKEASLKTFISLCVERKLINVIEKQKTGKNKILQESISLDHAYNEEGLPLKDLIGDGNLDPLQKYSEEENIEMIKEKITKQLSDLEMEVFSFMINGSNYHEIAKILDKSPKQIDNTIQRIRAKVRDLMKEDRI